MRFLLRNLELILTLAGLLVIVGVTALAEHLGAERWFATAIISVSVGVLHGLLFWIVRKRRRSVREAAIRDIRAMLSDIINNQLTVIEAAQGLGGANEKTVASISDSVRVISDSLRSLSEESLRKWQSRYQRLATA